MIRLIQLTAMLALAAPALMWANPQTTEPDRHIANQPPRIQLAILLDTSNSMDGLIDQARQQLWQVVNEFSKAKRNGVTPVFEVAVYEYGNTGIDARLGHVRQVVGLTRELDRVSEALFSLTTNGGDEYCGHVIAQAVNQLQWSASPNDVKAIFIAGNEPFTQGPTPFTEAIAEANVRGIVVNTIHAGDYQTGLSEGWQQGALLAGGNYMSIDHNQAVVHIEAPQDGEIANLNARLNETYIPYGREGDAGAARQQEQDDKSYDVSAGLLAERAESKATALYDNSGWDLVDAVEAGKTDLDELESDALPEEMQSMSLEARKALVDEKANERAELKAQIVELGRQRDAYVAEQRNIEAEQNGSTLNEALMESVREQAADRSFVFTE
ncbi:MAG TPA: vWA domain-containing protein [Woeseiaceae bacterium]|nr:vWA domain-containing protein [Woeseiaceae bacterium]